MKLFDVSYCDYPGEIYSARSASAARYECFMNIRDAIGDTSFIDFAKQTTVRALKRPIPSPYTYIKDYYGLTFNLGDRIETDGGRQGVVVWPQSDTHYVWFIPDGHNHSRPAHPGSVKVIGRMMEGEK